MPKRKGNKNHKGDRELFDRLPIEQVFEAMTVQQLRGFRIWESLPPGSRTYAAVAKEAGVSKQTVSNWDSTYNFERLSSSREIEIYKEADKLEKPHSIDKILNLRSRLEKLLDRIFEDIESGEFPLEIKSYKDISMMIRDYVQLRGILTPEEKAQEPTDNVQNNLIAFLGAGCTTDQVDRFLNVLETVGSKESDDSVKILSDDDVERSKTINHMDRETLLGGLDRVRTGLSPESRQKKSENKPKNGHISKFLAEYDEDLPKNEENGVVTDAEIVE